MRVATLLLGGLLAGLAVPVRAQTLDVVPAQPRATVGDIVTLDLRVRLRGEEQLIDLLPRTLLAPPQGVRIVSADTLRRSGDREYRGRVRIAFYRIGRQPVPTLSLLYRATPDAPPDTLVHAPLAIEIVPLLEPGNPRLRDIKPLERLGGPVWGPLAILLGLTAAGFFWLWHRARRRPDDVAVPAVALPRGPFQVALHRLAELEARVVASGNGVVPCYDEVAQILRQALVDAGAISHLGLTSVELAAELPSELAHGQGRSHCARLLGESDLVKFARLRPDQPAALAHLRRTRELLHRWSRDRMEG